MRNTEKIGIVWFRNDLRVTDHQALLAATATCSQVVAFYCIDDTLFAPTPWGFKKTKEFRVQFLVETLRQLQQDLDQLNITLIIETGTPVTRLSHWITTLSCTDLFFQKEWTPEEAEVENQLGLKFKPTVKFHSYYDQFLVPPDDLPFSVEALPKVFTEFRKAIEKFTAVRPCQPFSNPKPKENRLDLSFFVPSLEALGFSLFTQHSQSAFPFKGGSKAALERMHSYFWETRKVSYYKKTRNGLIGKDYSSKFSPWLANGSLSARQLYWDLKRYETEVEKNESTYWLVFELYWRDFFKYVSLKHGNSIFKLEGILGKKYEWKTDVNEFQRWCMGQTSEPFVNASMIELNKTGWMSNRGRQNTASYLARNMKIDWRMGAAYFESLLLDYDVHSNYGNWMYVAGVGNDPRDRVFNVRLQAERYDPHGKFQRMWNQNQLFE